MLRTILNWNLAKDYELARWQIELGEIIGEGQFGDVHCGTCTLISGQKLEVAIKTCKPGSDMATTEVFLEEACKLIEIFRWTLIFLDLLIHEKFIFRYNATVWA